MYSTGTSAGQGLLGGLSRKPSVAAYGKGRAMSSAAGLGMEKAKADTEMSSAQMQEESRQRMQGASNNMARAGNESQERIARGGMASRMANFNVGMNIEQAGADRRRALDFRQALFNSLTRDI